MSDEIPGKIFRIETYIKDLENPDDMVKKLRISRYKTNKELREKYKKRKEDNQS